MRDVLWTVMQNLTHTDEYVFVVVFGLAAVVLSLISSMLQSYTLAVLYAPILVIGGLAANYLFRVFFITTTHDKDSQVVIASAVGILVAMVLLLLATWLSSLMSERRSRKRKPQPLLPLEADRVASTDWNI